MTTWTTPTRARIWAGPSPLHFSQTRCGSSTLGRTRKPRLDGADHDPAVLADDAALAHRVRLLTQRSRNLSALYCVAPETAGVADLTERALRESPATPSRLWLNRQ